MLFDATHTQSQRLSPYSLPAYSASRSFSKSHFFVPMAPLSTLSKNTTIVMCTLVFVHVPCFILKSPLYRNNDERKTAVVVLFLRLRQVFHLRSEFRALWNVVSIR